MAEVQGIRARVGDIVESAEGERLPRAAPLRSVRSNFSWTLVGNVVYRGCQWGTLVALAKLGNVEMVGQFGLALAITAPIFTFASLQLSVVQVTDARGEYSFGEYFGARIITTVLAFIAACAIGIVSNRSALIIALVVAIAVSKAVEALSDAFYGLLQRHEAMDRIAKSLLLRGPLSLLAVALVVWSWHSVVGGAIALAVVWAAVLVGFDLPNGAAILDDRRLITPRFDAHIFVRLVRIAAPLGLVMMFASLITNIPRYFLEHHRGTHDLGIFVGLAYVVTAGTTVVGALGQSTAPRLANLSAAGDREGFSRLVQKLLLVGIALGAAGFLVALIGGAPLLRLLYTPEYAEYSRAFLVIMFAAAIGYVSSLLGFVITAARIFVQQLPLSIVATGATAVLSALLVPWKGVDGAAWVLVGGAFVQLVGFAGMYFRAVNRMSARTKNA
jgi:O-antigen/teichoic acid export membrane protein